jgi:hypothetical protein
MDRKMIKARRKAIEADAPCDGCGATLAACKSQRGKVPTAPSWFGCCARGTGMMACRHVPDSRALRGLIKEIERGEVRSTDDELLDSISEFPPLSRSLRNRVMAMAAADWPDDVPMPGEM